MVISVSAYAAELHLESLLMKEWKISVPAYVAHVGAATTCQLVAASFFDERCLALVASTNTSGCHLFFRCFSNVGLVFLLILGARDTKVILPVFTTPDAC